MGKNNRAVFSYQAETYIRKSCWKYIVALLVAVAIELPVIYLAGVFDAPTAVWTILVTAFLLSVLMVSRRRAWEGSTVEISADCVKYRKGMPGEQIIITFPMEQIASYGTNKISKGFVLKGVGTQQIVRTKRGEVVTSEPKAIKAVAIPDYFGGSQEIKNKFLGYRHIRIQKKN